MKLMCNCCDGIYNSFDVHFTKFCDNKCAHCVDNCYCGINEGTPNVDAICNTIIANAQGMDDVLFLGGEPCLYLSELLECIVRIREYTHLKVYVTTSMPKTCYDNKDLFFKIIGLVDGINISAQHYDEMIADSIRRTQSKYDRQAFYASLPHKEKIRINLNIVKPYMCSKEEITECLLHYDRMGFNSIKLSEIQHGTEHFVSFEKVFNVRYKSPYANGCQTYIDTSKIIPNMKTPLLLKRSCFACEQTLKPNLSDFVKSFLRMFVKQKNRYFVVYEDGTISKGWI